MTQDQLALLESLLWHNFRVALLLGGVWIAIAPLRARNGAFRHDVWLAAIAGCLLLPILSATLPTITLPWLPATEPAIGDVPNPVIGRGAGADTAPDVGLRIGAANASPIDFRLALLVTWVFGVVISIGWFAFGVTRVYRSESRMQQFPEPAAERIKDRLCATIGLRRRVRLLESEAGMSPHTWGVIHPRIVLPAQSRDWSSGQLENVLLHELGHIKRFDWLRLCLMRVAASVYWFNPLIWLAVRECRFEAERACDDFVLQAGGESTDYAEQLLELMTLRQKTADIGIALGDGCFARRVRSILTSTNEVRAMSKFATGIVAMAIVSGAGVLAACQVTSGQTPEPQVAGLPAISAEQEAERAEVRAREEAERAEVLAREEAERAEVIAREEAEVAAALARREARVAAEVRQSERMLEEARGDLERSSQSLQRPELARLASLEGELMERERVIRDLQRSLDRTSAELVETERQLEELQARLEETAPGL